MKVHPMFHNSLIKPYTETVAHGPNFELPPPEIIEGEEGHYEIERILMSRPTRNWKSTQYLVKCKGYPDSENSWLPEKELMHAKELLTKFHKTRINNIAGAMGPKEGILSRAKRATTQHPENICTINPSPQNPALKRSYSIAKWYKLGNPHVTLRSRHVTVGRYHLTNHVTSLYFQYHVTPPDHMTLGHEHMTIHGHEVLHALHVPHVR